MKKNLNDNLNVEYGFTFLIHLESKKYDCHSSKCSPNHVFTQQKTKQHQQLNINKRNIYSKMFLMTK